MKQKIKIFMLMVLGFLLAQSLMANDLNVVVIKHIDQFGKDTYKNLPSGAVLGIISKLAFKKHVVVNFEEVANDKQIVSFNVSDGTRLRDLLEQFLAQDPKYVYVVRDGIINIFPKAAENDETYLFNLRLKNFDIDHKNRREVVRLLRNEIGAEYPGKYQVNVNGKIYPKLGYAVVSGPVDFDLDLISMTFNGNNYTVREILNVISKKNNTFWNAIQLRNAGIQTGQIVLNLQKEFQDEFGIQSTKKKKHHGDEDDEDGDHHDNVHPKGH